jgi:hypothetical protein
MKIAQNIYGLDAAHMKHSRYAAQLLLLTGRDGAWQNFTVGYAIVPTECEEHYVWFLLGMCQNPELKAVLNCQDTVIFSDRQKGLKSAVDTCLPLVHHVNCFKHIVGNIRAAAASRKKYRGVRPLSLTSEANRLCWMVCKATTKGLFDSNMAELASINPGGWSCTSLAFPFHSSAVFQQR